MYFLGLIFVDFFIFILTQVRSLAAESERAYQGGPLEHLLYQEASLSLVEDGVNVNVNGLSVPTQFSSILDWFAVDLEGEHSAMDGQILEEHTEYVVYAIHRVSLFSLFNKFPELVCGRWTTANYSS